MGLPLKFIQKFQLLESVMMQPAKRACFSAYVTSILYELHWLLVCIWVQFKVLMVAFKDLHGLGLGYEIISHLLFLLFPFNPVRKVILWMQSAKKSWMEGPFLSWHPFSGISSLWRTDWSHLCWLFEGSWECDSVLEPETPSMLRSQSSGLVYVQCFIITYIVFFRYCFIFLVYAFYHC